MCIKIRGRLKDLKCSQDVNVGCLVIVLLSKKVIIENSAPTLLAGKTKMALATIVAVLFGKGTAVKYLMK